MLRNSDESSATQVDRRQFIRVASAASIAVGGVSCASPRVWAEAIDGPSTKLPAESDVQKLYKTLTETQRSAICFDWDHVEPERGLLRSRIANNWQITDETILSDFYTDEQRDIVRAIYEGILHPDWHARFDKQLEDDSGGYGENNSIAIFGEPGSGKFEFVMTGRHMTIRCDGDSADHVAFGGPIFYGHAAESFNEEAHHPGNVFWPQAMVANDLYKMLDGRQRDLALVKMGMPPEENVRFQGAEGKFAGIPVSELSRDQAEHLQKVVQKLIEPYRQSDRDEVVACLKKQGGIEACSLAFFEEGDIGEDKVWDNWRLEGPSFVWHFRGAPHVHVWVNVANDASVELNA